jgi:hypothetical protein
MYKAKADVWLKDYQGKTAFDYIKKATSKRENIFNMQTYNSLKNLEVHQIIGDKANIISSYINVYKNIHRISIKGAKCEAFTLPKNVQCTYIETTRKDIPTTEKYISDIKRGVPPLFAAIQNSLSAQLSALLDSGEDIEMENKFGGTPLIFALKQYEDKDDKLVKILLEYSANPNVMYGNGLYSALSKICVTNPAQVSITNKMSTIKLLLEYGADVNYQHKKSETALTVAAKGCKNFELVKFLLDKGADPTLIDVYGMNTLTGLKRYCRDITAHYKMKTFIEWNSL